MSKKEKEIELTLGEFLAWAKIPQGTPLPRRLSFWEGAQWEWEASSVWGKVGVVLKVIAHPIVVLLELAWMIFLGLLLVGIIWVIVTVLMGAS